jgi:hypothetical protein
MDRNSKRNLVKPLRSPEVNTPWDDADAAAPSSPYDGPDDGWPGEQDDASDSPWDALRGRVGADEDRAPGLWRAALAACAEPFAEAAAGLARLDERLRIMAPPERAAARDRLAALQACRLMWGEGVIVAPEAVALDALDRRGRAGEDAPAVTAARRLARRLAREPGRSPATAARDPADADAAGTVASDVGQSDAGRSERGASDAAECDAALRGAPPLVAAALAAPSADALSEAARLDAAAARLTAAALGGRGGASFAPAPARRRAAGFAPETRLSAFVRDVADGTRDALALLDDLAAWRARADAAADAMKGATPARLVALLARRPALSAPAAASALSLSDDAALRALARLAEAGLARELTGQGRFRVWTAKL